MTEEITFALDIGTRTIIGLLVKKEGKKYKIINSAVSEHQTRAMLDGQIHNVADVAAEVKKVKEELEAKSGITLNKAAVAAAGRALKTVSESAEIDLEKSRYIKNGDVNRLEILAIQAAQNRLKKSDKKENFYLNYHFVGYTVSSYYLDNMEIGSLVGQRGKNLRVDLVATFLPRVVIDSLLSVISSVGLEVDHITLEPIAASQVVIPESMRGFNLALVDIGAGTSDIAVTKGGSIIGYDMVPTAGDEITEKISEKFLIDYNSAEKIKCSYGENEILKSRTILGDEIEITREDIKKAVEPELDDLTHAVAASILKINKTPPQAVIFIGGGSLTPELKNKFAEKIDLIESRIGIRHKDDLDNVAGEIDNINSAQTLTPIGIAVTARETKNRAVFIDVSVNNEAVNLLSISKPTVADALLAADIDIGKLTASPGMGLTCTVNGKMKVIKGELGQPGELLLNDKKAELDTELSSGDNIIFEPAKPGKNAEALIKDVIPEKDIVDYNLYLNGSKNRVGTKIYQNNKLLSPDSILKDGSEINYTVPRTIRDGLSQILEIPSKKLDNKKFSFYFNGKKEKITDSLYIIKENGREVNPDRKLENNLYLEIEEKNTPGLTAAEFLKSKGHKNINFVFNGSSLNIPDKIWKLTVNGEEKDLNYKIKEGDQIEAESKPLQVRGVFEYINYNISKSMLDSLIIEINGSKADLSAQITEGDKLYIAPDKK
ncbi:cell division protein FtsA [Halanaerobium sp. MA284_MarDTE_T2]|nr:cell division FtsA domain-containing protein [Halanaerobium sp. MA284_MarDTE_T2]RCW41238.1 cell division protein FtsA [Halanaerobium sp. MA284_MarDTE_T2]